jgi:hypothetical protein
VRESKREKKEDINYVLIIERELLRKIRERKNQILRKTN